MQVKIAKTGYYDYKSPQAIVLREMEYTECASFIEIYGLLLA